MDDERKDREFEWRRAALSGVLEARFDGMDWEIDGCNEPRSRSDTSYVAAACITRADCYRSENFAQIMLVLAFLLDFGRAKTAQDAN